MYNFQALVNYDPSILDGVSLVPDGIDVDTLKGAIMMQCGLLQPLFSEPSTMKNAIYQWFSERAWTFEHLLNIINAEYSPIENTDRYDETTRNIARALDRDVNDDGTDTRSTSSSVETEGENIGQVSAFNSSDWQNSDKNNSTGSTTGSENVTDRNIRKNSTDEDENTKETFTQHLHGNIGVTTNQDMIEQELALLAHFNIYTWIAMNLRDALFLEVY